MTTRFSMLDETIARLDRKRPRVLAELHPLLRERVAAVIVATGGRLTPWEGYRDRAGQDAAYVKGTSQAMWLQSPHNYKPALACDLVLDPRHVEVRSHPTDRRYPWLWDNESPEALEAWAACEEACRLLGLERVTIRDLKTGERKRDLPHVQLPNWRSYLEKTR